MITDKERDCYKKLYRIVEKNMCEAGRKLFLSEESLLNTIGKTTFSSEVKRRFVFYKKIPKWIRKPVRKFLGRHE